jgi:peptide/nickel transport system substrate-binding protein/oligopeptide transport system substrate-binding protein
MLLIQPPPDSQYGGTLHVAYTVDIQTLDPHRVNIFYDDFDSSLQVINQIFQGLVTYKSGTAEIEPALAESWDISDDGRVYTFHLRKNVLWHDGNTLFPEGESRNVNADDFVYSWDRVTDSETLSPMKDFVLNTAKVESWQSRGSYTFEVTLKQPNPSFLYMLPFPCFLAVPQEAGQYGVDNFSSHAVGSGPFEIKSWPDTVSLKYNEDYWEGEPFVTELHYHYVREDDLLKEFNRGSIDWFLIPSHLWEECSQYTITAVPQFEILYVGMNCQKPPFTDRRVRQAINYALDPGGAIDEIYKGRAAEAVSVLPPGFVCYNEREPPYARNVEKAIQLLDEAGYTGSPRFTLELKSSESYIQQQFNALYTEQLNEVGVHVDVTYLDVGSLLHAVDTGDTQLFTLGWYIDWPYPDQFLFLFHSSNWGPGGNGCFYRNEIVDDLLEQAGIEPDITTACQLFQKAEDMIIEDSVWVLQWRRTDGYVIQEWIQGFNPGGMGEKYELLDTVWISQDHRQITRIPQNTGQQDNELTSHGAGVVVLALIVTAFILKRRPK